MNDVRKSVQDAAYTAVGVGALGAQQVAQLSEQAVDAVKHQLGAARERISDRVEPLVADVRDRIEPFVERIQAKTEGVVTAGTAKARALLGRDRADAAATPTAGRRAA